jgi:hypothetical protein
LFLKDPSTELNKLKPQYFYASSEFVKEKKDFFNSGVMWINIENMAKTTPLFREVLTKTNFFNKRNDEGSLNEFYKGKYDFLDIKFNWKPYWGINKDAIVVHFHGPKPMTAKSYLEGNTRVSPVYTPLINKNTVEAYQYYTNIYFQFNPITAPSTRAKNIEIVQTGCRFGNIVQSLTNLYLLAKNEKLKVTFKENLSNEISFKNFDFSDGKNIESEKKALAIYFPDKFNFQIKEKLDTMQKIFELVKKEPVNFDPKSTLVIHIRSGDLFNSENPVWEWYIQPPLCFYTKIINELKKENLLIITEPNLKNPCIAELKKLYPFAKIQTSSLSQDISSILAAETLVIGKGTFGKHLALMSKNLKELYIFEQNPQGVNYINMAEIDKSLIKFNFYLYKADDYITSWKNNPPQLSKMISLPESNLVLIREKN